MLSSDEIAGAVDNPPLWLLGTGGRTPSRDPNFSKLTTPSKDSSQRSFNSSDQLGSKSPSFDTTKVKQSPRGWLEARVPKAPSVLFSSVRRFNVRPLSCAP